MGAPAPPPADQANAAAKFRELFTGIGASQADAQAAADHYIAAAAKMITSGDYALPAEPANGQAPAAAAPWNAQLHPRGPGGQFGQGSTGATPTNAKPVGLGASGEQVRQLQERLNALGAKPPLALDGKFGPKTLAAVRQYQQTHLDAHGKPLKVDGLVGPLTTGALRSATQKTTKTSTSKTSKTGKTGRTSRTSTSKTSRGGKTSTSKTSTSKTTAKQPATARAIAQGKKQAAPPKTPPVTVKPADKPGSISPAQKNAVNAELQLRQIPPDAARQYQADLKILSQNDASALLTYIRNTYTFKAAAEIGAGIAALFGLDADEARDTHGRWTATAGGAGAPAARLHGKQVRGHTETGNDVRGRYDHGTKEVLDRFGARHKVTRVRAEDDTHAAKGGPGQGNRGNAETLRRYWSTGGEGGAKIRWGEPGDHMRCVAQLVEHGHFTTEQAHGYCNLLEKRNTGEYPAQHAKEIRDAKKAAGPEAAPDVVAFKLDELRDRLGKWRHGGGGGAKGPKTRPGADRGGWPPPPSGPGPHRFPLSQALSRKQVTATPHGESGVKTLHGPDGEMIGAIGPHPDGKGGFGAVDQDANALPGRFPDEETATREVIAQRNLRHVLDLQLQGSAEPSEPAPAPGLPSLVTIPSVDILAAGTWALSTGRQTFTSADLQSAIDASNCPAVGLPVIKIGHLDPRFTPQPEHDGEPAIGRVQNLRLSGNGAKIVGDLAGMPGWLGAIAASAFPRRSVEGKYGFKCQIGHSHPFVLTGLALLGVTPPGVGVLSGLPDIASLYGLTAAAAQAGQEWRTEQDQEGTVMAVTEEDVRRAFYAQAGAPQSWWITELQMFPPQLICADEQSGKIYRVGYRIDGSAVAFDQPDEVASYADVAANRGTGPVVAYASAADSRSVVVAAWDGGAAVRQLGDNPSPGAIRAMFAIPGSTKSDSSLPHHEVNGGKVGAANPDGCSAAIAALNGGRGGMKGVSASQAKAAYTHLAAHLRAAGRTPPDFTGAEGDGDGQDWRTAPIPAADLGETAEQIARQLEHIAATYGDRGGGGGGEAPPGQDPDGGQEPGTEQEPGSLAARWERLIAIRAAATDSDADDTVQGLVASLDATLDQAAELAGQVDPKTVPEAAGQVLALVVAAEALVDQLMDKLGIYDPDDTDSDTSAAAGDDETEGGEGVAAAGDTVHEPMHGNFDGSHSHPHRAYGTQGSDETHDHKHTHSGDGRHDHAHETEAAADAAASQQEGNPGMGYEFTTQQMAAIRARLGKQEGEAVSTDDIAAVFGAPQPPWPVQAAVAGTGGEGPVEVPVIADGVHLVEANILRKYQEEALAGQRAVRAMHVAERDVILAAAVKEGKFAQSRLDHFKSLWDRDPDGTRKLVASLAGGLVPMIPTGSNGDWATDPDMPGDFDAQRAYRDLYPEDVAGGISPAPGVRAGGR